ncbi:MAG: transposase [Archaeoglobi archaeon]|nr:transposase [Archaeoglobi archaeon]
MEYDRDLNACINIARRLMRSAGWGSLAFERGEGRKVLP